MRYRRALGIFAVALLVTATLSGGTQAGAARRARRSIGGPTRVLHSIKNDVSPPVSSLPTARRHSHRKPVEAAQGELPQEFPAQSGHDEAVQRAAVGPSAPALGTNFPGIASNATYIPPDTNGDVGPNEYVQAVNARYAVYDKTGGTELQAPMNINTIFDGFGGRCQTTNRGDPIVQYDQLADRWLISQFAFNVNAFGLPIAPFYQCVAISTSGDPTDTYYRYQFESTPDFNDYGKFGVWPDAYYLTTNEFDADDLNTFTGIGTYALDRAKMLEGEPATALYKHLGPTNGPTLPADLDGPTPPPAGAPNYMVQFKDGTAGNDVLDIVEFHADFVTPANTTLTPTATLTTADFDSNMCNGSQSCIPQLATGNKLDAIAALMMYRLAYRNFGDHQAMVLNHTVDANGSDRAGPRWYELRKTTGNWSIYQQGTFSPDSLNRWMGSIAMDKAGDIALGYSASSSSAYPSIRYTGRVPGDALGTMQAETTMKSGGGSQVGPSNRWGDYSSMSVDPDGCTFWYTNEYYSVGHSINWKTHIGSFSFPTCATTPAVTIDDVTVTEGDAGTANATFDLTLTPANTSQTVQVTYSTANGTATSPSDYTSVSGANVSFAPNETAKQVSVTVKGDTSFEKNEDFFVNLTAATNAVIEDGQGVGTIANNDPSPPALSIDDVDVTEGDSGTTDAVFTVTLDPVNPTQQVDVNWATQDATAKQPGDYNQASGSLSFAANEFEKTLTVQVNGDVFPETNEEFLVDLSAPVNAVIDDGGGVGTIENDDEGDVCTGVGTDGDDNLVGTPENDVLCGFGGDDTLMGEGGDDVLDGGDGRDFISYDDASAAVNVNLTTGTAVGAAGADTIVDVEDLEGSAFADKLVGSGDENSITGLTGSDQIDGAGDTDFVVYSGSPSGVIVNLRDGLATGGQGKDHLSNIEGIYGSAYKDFLTGKGNSNTIFAGARRDTLIGLGGDDFLYGEEHNDTFDGGKGLDTCVQGPGSGTRKSCELSA